MAENKTKNELVLKSVYQLLGYRFLIPDYQRGYRWRETQIEQFLKDVWDFSKKSKKDGEFYCLQPIVVREHKENNEWEVIDGQQRLTTIYIILKYLEDLFKFSYPEASLYKIRYSTRGSEKFLENIKNADHEDEIDFYFMKDAYLCVEKWFDVNKEEVDLPAFLKTFVCKPRMEKRGEVDKDMAENVRVIWYEVGEMENNDSVDVFTRLNDGKIPLTNSELIKALFLQKGNFTETEATLKQLQIASEWDVIEKTLQDNRFWFFIYNPDNPLKYENRIEYIFDVMKERTKDSEYYHTFNEFSEDFFLKRNDKMPVIEAVWLDIKQFFMTFEEWHNDYKLFHYIGYLISCIEKNKDVKAYSKEIIKLITDLRKNFLAVGKKEFKKYLKNEIKNKTNFEISDLNYKKNKDKKRIRNILLLFNIITVLEEKSDMRFPFDKYKSQDNSGGWDIEHARSQNEKEINSDEQLAWIENIMEFFSGSKEIKQAEIFIAEKKEKLIDNDENKDSNKKTIEDIQEIIKIVEGLIELKKATKIEKDDFIKVFNSVREYFKESLEPDNIHSISNLALLDAETNRSYGNAFFPIKRKRIIKNDKSGIFVPIATKNLFLKYYSKKLGEVMYWNEEDADDYLNAIKTTLDNFFNK